MASKCTKCGNTDNYNFALNIGLCDICIGEELGRIKELERRLLEHLKGHSLEAICDECSSHYWYVDDETIICPHCFPKQALKG